MTGFGCENETGALRRVLLKHPRRAFRTQAALAEQWEPLGYTAMPDLDLAIEQFDAFAGMLREAGADLEWLPDTGDTGPDSLYTHDPMVMTPAGAVLGRMGKRARAAEPEAVGAWLRAEGVPIVGRVEPPGTLEGGDVVWLDAQTVAVGEGYRTNAAGIAQLAAFLGDGVEVIAVPLPHWTGPGDCLHLMSLLSPVDHDLAVVYSPLLPVPFRNRLQDRGLALVEVPPSEWGSMGCNVLATAPRRCLMLQGNPITRSRLEGAGAAVRVYRGSEISLKGGGGPTCLTRPILRT